jgi:hypothetical protein
MKKVLSILFAVTIVLSGMHLSLDTHLCGGALSAIKLSFTSEKANCGMGIMKQTFPAEKSFTAESCCKDEMSYLAVDTNYNPSTIELNKPAIQLLQVFYIPSTIGVQCFNTKVSSNTNVQPPGNFIACAVNLPDICVFLI